MSRSNNAADDRVMTPLNLVMKLAPGRTSGVAENKAVVSAAIKKAADTLGTIHEMRFVQVDEETVMFLATYDGGFDEMMRDLAQHLSHVFDLVLSNVIDPPILLVEQNPQAFVDWTQTHNLPTLSVYYSAYPGLSVREIWDLRNRG